MNSIIELILKLAGGVILLFSTGYTFAQISGYGEHYDKMLYNDDGEMDVQISGDEENYNKMLDDDNRYADIKLKNNNNNDEHIAHHLAI